MCKPRHLKGHTRRSSRDEEPILKTFELPMFPVVFAVGGNSHAVGHDRRVIRGGSNA
jgi:hypothetical protein